jgi:hypothetical protein
MPGSRKVGLLTGTSRFSKLIPFQQSLLVLVADPPPPN